MRLKAYAVRAAGWGGGCAWGAWGTAVFKITNDIQGLIIQERDHEA